MPELTNVRAAGVLGALVYYNSRGEPIAAIGGTGSTGVGIPYGLYNQFVVNITAATTLAPSTHVGAMVTCTTDAIVITLPAVAASTAAIQYDIMNLASSGGALLEIKTNSATDYFVVGGTATATSNLVLANTKATQQFGDNVSVACSGSTCWIVENRVGTWVAQTGS